LQFVANAVKDLLAVDLYDWLLFLHVLSAFFAVGALAALWGLILGTRGAAPMLDQRSAMTYGRTAGILVGVGMLGAIIFGVWLAIHEEAYQVWDGWILASLVLWIATTNLFNRLNATTRQVAGAAW